MRDYTVDELLDAIEEVEQDIKNAQSPDQRKILQLDLDKLNSELSKRS